jgi:hypothetical protein
MRAPIALMVAGLLGLTACSSGSDETSRSADTTAPRPTTTTTASTQPADPVAARADVEAAFATFFDNTLAREDRIAVVEDAAELEPAFVEAGAIEPPGVTSAVDSISFTSPTEALVTFTISVNGTPALPNFPGSAVFTDGAWKVSRTTVCDLLAQSQITCPD